MQLSTSPQRETVFRLEARKSFALGLRFQDADEKALDLTGAVVRLVAKSPDRYGGEVVLDMDAELVASELGLARFDVQASDLDLPAGREYPFAVVFVSAIGYSTVILKGIIDLQENTEVESTLTSYAGINPGTSLAVAIESGKVIEITVDRIDGFSLIVEQRIAEFTAEIQGLLDAALAEADEYISEAAAAAEAAAASATSAAASAAAANTIIENALNFNPLDLVPAGASLEWYDDIAPPGWALEVGQIVPRVGAYERVFARYGTRFGAGDGVSTFQLPNRRKRVAVGKDETDPAFDTIGKTGGALSTKLTSAHLPEHDHSISHGHAASSGESGYHDHGAVITEAGWHVHNQNVSSEAASGSGVRSDYVTDSGGDGSAAYPQGVVTDGAGQHGHPIDIHHDGQHTHPVTVTDHTGRSGKAGAADPAAISLLQPYIVVNHIIKL